MTDTCASVTECLDVEWPRPAENGSSRLGTLGRGARGRVIGIAVGPAHTRNAVDPHELERRLLEMGFVEGAHFEILHEGPVRRDPIALRLDDTRVALRRREAHALIVEIDIESPIARR